MTEWLIPIFIFYCIFLIMATSKKSTTEKSPAKTQAAASVEKPMSETKPAKSSSEPKKPSKVESPKASEPAQVPSVAEMKEPAVEKAIAKAKVTKPRKKVTAEVEVAETITPPATTSELSMSERVGLTAGSIWHYLSENGATSVAKLVRELPEEEKIVQRSIGWLAQEDKITLEIIDRVETLGLKQ